MNLAVFDIDGTLLDTMGIDSDCFNRALGLEWGISVVGQDWSVFTHATDSGITREVFEMHFRRPPTEEELMSFLDRFLGLLKAEYGENPGRIARVPGAGQALKRLSDAEDWGLALATGGRRASAVFKMNQVGWRLEDFPCATSDDAVSREEIVSLGIRRARQRYGAGSFERIVSIGDGTWDVTTAANLGLPFIGVGGADWSGRGVRHFIYDYNDLDGFLRLLDEAEVPKNSGESPWPKSAKPSSGR